MLDYRAHKLYWLMSLPVRLVSRLTYFAIIIAAILIAQSTAYSTLVKIIIGYASFEGIMLVLFIFIFAVLGWALRRLFFFLIDVVPAHGDNEEEAREIALTGRAFELNKKFETDIANWTDKDTAELAALASWRARLFFKVRNRIENTVWELQRIYEETGQQPRQLGLGKISKIRESFPGGKVTWLETALVDPRFFNSLLGFAIITVAIWLHG
jgi:hypothetical protein